MTPPVFIMYSSLCSAQLYLNMLPYSLRKVNSDMVFHFEKIFCSWLLFFVTPQEWAWTIISGFTYAKMSRCSLTAAGHSLFHCSSPAFGQGQKAFSCQPGSRASAMASDTGAAEGTGAGAEAAGALGASGAEGSAKASPGAEETLPLLD